MIEFFTTTLEVWPLTTSILTFEFDPMSLLVGVLEAVVVALYTY
jgi:hypothetical protein